ncbi:MAG: hypothetical protein IJY09_01680 [Lachnospiraceae bacterium]|nr:hypothetical protein [Lachnospiraceae bacterium]
MKALHKFLTALLLILSLTACTSGSSEPYTILKGENSFTVDPVNHSISDGENIYLYELDGNSSDCNIKITYPNGSTYWWHSQTSGGMTTGYGGQSDDYDAAINAGRVSGILLMIAAIVLLFIW